jgi:uncharacterized protein (PEP-CTERM system associated)
MNHRNNPVRARVRSTQLRVAIAAAIVGVAAALPAHAELEMTPRLGLTAVWMDNVDLAQSPTPKQEEYIGQITPGLHLEQSGQRVNTYLDYEAQALFYEKNSDRDEIFHHGDLGLSVEAVPDWFFVDVGGRYAQSIVDPAQPANRGNLFGVGNLIDTASATITPALRHTFGKVDLVADYTRGFVDYRDTLDDGAAIPAQAEDSDNEEANFSLGSSDRGAFVTWLARYRWERVEYDTVLPFEYERADGEIGLRVTNSLRLIGRGGVESDPTQLVATGGLEESFWDAGFSWSRDEGNELRLLVGERFFGTSYEALLRLSGRFLTAEFGYNQDPTTQSQRFALRELPTAMDPEPVADPVFGRVDAETFLSKRLYGELGLKGRFTEIRLLVTSEEREYVRLAGIEDRFRSVELSASRRFGARTTGEIGASVMKADLREGGSFDEDLYRISLSRELGQRTELVLAGYHLERSGDLQNYDSNWVSLGLQMTF